MLWKCLNLFFFFQKEYLTWQKTLMLGKIGGGRRRGWQRMTGGLACCSPRGRKELDMTGRLKNNNSDNKPCLLHYVWPSPFAYTHKKWFVTPAWTCSFHQDEGRPWFENALQFAGTCPHHGVLASYQLIFCSEFFWLTFYSSKPVPFFEKVVSAPGFSWIGNLRFDPSNILFHGDIPGKKALSGWVSYGKHTLGNYNSCVLTLEEIILSLETKEM